MKSFQLASVLLVLALSIQFREAVAQSGSVVSWGRTIFLERGAIPSPENYYSTNLVRIAGHELTNVVKVAAGNAQALALTADGRLFGWGNNSSGQATGIKTDYPFLAEGLVQNADQALSNVTAIASGLGFSLALKKDGTVVAMGDDQSGQTDLPAGLADVTAISAGGNHSLVLRRDGSVAGWGKANLPPEGLSNILAIAAGGIWDYGHDLALTREGTVLEWPLRGVPRVISTAAVSSNVIAVAAGWNHSLALKADGTVLGWGDNSVGQASGTPSGPAGLSMPGGPVTIGGEILTNVIAIAAGNEYSLALRKDGTVISWGHPIGMEMTVPTGLSDVVAIAAGENFCLAITTSTNFPGMKK